MIENGSLPVELSFVIPAYNEQDNIIETIHRVVTEAERLVSSFELILVDDGSSDNTCELIKSKIASFQCLRLIRFSRNFGKEHAIMAGLERSSGNAVVILDADPQEPLSYLESMLKYRDEGYEMVYAVRASRVDESLRKRLFTKLFYNLLNYGADSIIPANARDFRLMDRRVVDAICSLPERNRFMKGLFGWVGFRTKEISIHLERRAAGESKFGFKNLFKLGLTAITAFTAWPLRVWTAIGVFVATLSILFGAWVILRTFLFGVDLPGWASLVVAISFLGGIQLISIGVLGEYIARIFVEVKGRPSFIIAEDISSFDEY